MDRSVNNSSTTRSRPATDAEKEQHAREFADERRRETLDTITYQRSALRTIMGSELAKNMEDGIRKKCEYYLTYYDTLKSLHDYGPEGPNDYRNFDQDVVGPRTTMGNLINTLATRFPGLEQEMDRKAKGAYKAAIEHIDYSMKSWEPKGYTTFASESGQVDDET